MPKRELIEPKGDKRFARRTKNGRFSEQDDVGKSLAQDQAGRQTARQAGTGRQGRSSQTLGGNDVRQRANRRCGCRWAGCLSSVVIRKGQGLAVPAPSGSNSTCVPPAPFDAKRKWPSAIGSVPA